MRVDAPEERQLERPADQRQQYWGHHQRDPEVVRCHDHRVSGIGADHVEGSVRQVEHVHQPEDDRETGSQQEDEAAESEAVDDQLKRGADSDVKIKKPPT